jgi:hypothetical protein
MKVWTSKYRNHWVSPYTILKAVCFWERDEDRIYNLKDEPNNPYERWVKFLNPICTAWMAVLDFVHPRWNYVKLDEWDTWSFDHTLADIVLPGLKQLRATKHGAPFTDDADVPEYLRSHMAQPKEHEWDTDSLHFMRWDWILDEMIFAFEKKAQDDWTSEFHTGEIDWTWVPVDAAGNKVPKGEHRYYTMEKGPKDTHVYDAEGAQKVQERITNGFRLFGKYYENLWS